MTVIGIMMTAVASLGDITLIPELRFGYRGEAGVEQKVLISGGLNCEFWDRVYFLPRVSIGLFENPGIAGYGIHTRVVIFDRFQARFPQPARRLRAGLELQAGHQEWSDWQVGENCAGVTLFVQPLRQIDLTAGLAYRVPVLKPKSHTSPFLWGSDAAEFNYLYRLDWVFLNRRAVSLSCWVSNYDEWRVRNPSQFPFGLKATYAPKSRWQLKLRAATEIKGLSGLLVSPGALTVDIGSSYEW